MGAILPIKVMPQSGRQALVWCEKQHLLKVYVKSEPVRNKANDEVVKYLAKRLGIPRDDIAIVAGHTVRRKKVRIEGFDDSAAVLAAGGVARQQTLG